jgi:hypothetical protein
VSGTAELGPAVAAFGLSGPADLHQELAVRRELEDLVVLVRVTRDPDIAVGVDHDAVLALRPFVARARPAPAAHVIARGVKLGDRRQGFAAAVRHRLARLVDFIGEQRRRTMRDPDVSVALIDGDARDLADDELHAGVLGQRLRPGRVDPELRHPEEPPGRLLQAATRSSANIP